MGGRSRLKSPSGVPGSTATYYYPPPGPPKSTGQPLLEMDLAEIRKMLDMTQAELAAKLEMTQGQVSQTESRQDLKLSTLRRYVRALDGELEVVARFGDKSIKLHAAS